MNDKSSFTILVSVGNPIEQQNLTSILESEGYSVKTALSYEDFVKEIKWLGFDLILIDMDMAMKNNFELCRKVEELSQNASLPIVFLVSQIDQEIILKGFENGGADYICRPFMPEELSLRVQLILDNKRKEMKLISAKRDLEIEVRKRTKELETANEKLTRLDSAKNDFLHLISHELKTPLTGLTGVMEVLKAAGAEEEWKEYLAIIKPSVSRLKRFSEYAILITSLLAGNKLKKRLVPMDELIKESLYEIVPYAQNRNVQIVNYCSLSDIKIFAQKDLIVECIISIIENAIKFSPNNSRIVLKSTYKESHISLLISDEGGGFSKEALERLYQFFASDNISEHTEGFGLGLAAAKLIMEAHDGKISISSSKEGSTVHLSFRKF